MPRRVLPLILVLAFPARALFAAPAELPGNATKFLENRCFDCHDEQTKKGNLDLTSLSTDFADRDAFARWVKVHDRLRDGEMPPKKKEQPTAPERETMLKTLSGVLSTADTQRQREQGRVPLRRLNRAEYENTIRDLFSMPGLQVKEMLPEDGRLDGFDKASAALAISSVQLRKYLEAADYVLDTAIAHQDKPMVWKEHFRRLGGLHCFGEATFPIKNGKPDMQMQKLIHPEGAPSLHALVVQQLMKNVESVGIMTTARPSFEPEVENFSPFHSGFYRIKTSLWSFDVDKGESKAASRMQSFALTANGRLLAQLDAPSLKPQEHELVVWLNAAETLQLNPANLWNNYNSLYNYVGPCVAVDYVDVEGPLNESWPPASHRRLFGNLPLTELSFVKTESTPPELYPRQPVKARRKPGYRPDHTDGKEFQKYQPVWTAASSRPAVDAEQLLKDFLPRAFRRPVPPEEVAVYVQIAREKLAAGDYFETAMRVAYRTALCSPDFLFLQEPPANPKDKTSLDQYAVASRLSYFLWNSMPDDELLKLAETNRLGGELGKQVDRMLADQKSDRFVNDFLDQWLGLRDIDFTSPDVKLYPEFRYDLRDAMLAETRAFFREMLTQDLGVTNFIDSDFLMINQRLAEHYEVPSVEGYTIRRVPKPADSPRGGLLTQAAILKITANGTTTSPVKRGAWVMDRLLGRPPQPQPPDVPAVDPDTRGLTTIRAQLDKHRNSAICASCHVKIDPPGFALESFDVIGSWRTKYRFVGEKVEYPDMRPGEDPEPGRFLGIGLKQWGYVLDGVRSGLPVDCSGTTPEGQAFRDIFEYKKLLLSDEEGLAGNLVSRLILYATGAPVSFADRAQVDLILQQSRDSHFGVRTLVRQLVLNPTLFRRK
jgi:hypothetical protein